ncbi:Whole genome shotgun sequence [Vibrio rotiferianus]|nr:Whole genome shotgun sequence [Vibrio rotiferianus]
MCSFFTFESFRIHTVDKLFSIKYCIFIDNDFLLEIPPSRRMMAAFGE